MNIVKKIFFIFFTIVLTGSNLNAQTPHYIDFQKILNESTAGKKAQIELKNRLDQTIKKLEKNQKDLQEQEKKNNSTKKTYFYRRIQKTSKYFKKKSFRSSKK